MVKFTQKQSMRIELLNEVGERHTQKVICLWAKTQTSKRFSCEFALKNNGKCFLDEDKKLIDGGPR